MKNGLWQGCTLAPTLFNIFFGAVVVSRQDECAEAGVDEHGRKLVGDRTTKSRLSMVTESQFADDVQYIPNPETLESL